MKFSFVKAILSVAISASAVISVHAQVGQVKPAQKQIRNEVGIMLDILKASLKQKSTDRGMRFRPNAVFYLAEQGVVFEIDSNSHNRSFFDFDVLLNNLPIAPNAPVPPIVKTDGNRVEINIDQGEIEAMVQNFIRHGNDDFDDDMRDNMRDLVEEKRELAWEKREYERRKRDLEFEKRSADGERRKNIDSQLAELSQEVKVVDAKSSELDKYLSELETEHKREMAIRDAAQKKLYREALSAFEDTIGEVLCSYGAGLKSLPKDENITFLLSDFVDSKGDSAIKSHDKVYVFKQSDVKACVTGRLNKEGLLGKANTYLF